MVVLKKKIKIRGASLVEVLVASVLIVIVFTISSLTINNLFKRAVSNATTAVESRLNELEYLYFNQKLKLPYFEDFMDGEISLILKGGNKLVVDWVRGEQKINRALFLNE